MSTIELKATTRDLKESVKELREKHFVPGVLYGHGIENKSLTVALNEFTKAYKQAGESTLVDLKIDEGEPVKVLVHAIERNVESNVPEHVDFYQVNMKEKLNAEIPLVLTGESSAVKSLGGTLMTQIESIPVRCLPGDLVDSFTLDISALKDFNDRIFLSDIQGIPETMEVLRPLESVVALVAPPRVVEVETTADDEETPAEGEEKTEEAKPEGEGEPAKEAAEQSA